MTETEGRLEEIIAGGCREMGLEIGQGEMSAFRVHYEVLAEENQRHNLTSITGEKEVAVKHFLDSLSCLKFIGPAQEMAIDLGSGAGFPGIPLKICRPGMDLVLVDSVKKKADFISGLIGRLGLAGARSRWDRAESMGKNEEFREMSRLVVSRAVAPLNILAELCLPLTGVGGGAFLAMKGPGWKKELESAGKAIALMGGAVEKVERIVLPFIPEERCLILIRKTTTTPPAYPRRPGIPVKRPLV